MGKDSPASQDPPMEAGESPLDTGQTSAAAASLVVAPPAIAPEGDAEPEEEEHGESSPCSADVLPKKRKGKSTRWNIPKHALTTLEQVFTRDKFPTVDTRNNLATELKVTPRQVQVWFQNKRQRSLKPPVKASSTEQQPPQQILSTSARASPHPLCFCPISPLVLVVSAWQARPHPGGPAHSLGCLGFGPVRTRLERVLANAPVAQLPAASVPKGMRGAPGAAAPRGCACACVRESLHGCCACLASN